MPFVQTDRLSMIPFTRELVEAALKGKAALANVSQLSVHPEWPQPDFEEIFPFLRGLLLQDPSLGEWFGLIVREDEIVGDMGFKNRPDESGAVEFGYSVVPALQNRGYATEMARGLIEWAFRQEGVTIVKAECLADNRASARVLEKAGLTQVSSQDGLLQWEIRKK